MDFDRVVDLLLLLLDPEDGGDGDGHFFSREVPGDHINGVSLSALQHLDSYQFRLCVAQALQTKSRYEEEEDSSLSISRNCRGGGTLAKGAALLNPEGIEISSEFSQNENRRRRISSFVRI